MTSGNAVVLGAALAAAPGSALPQTPVETTVVAGRHYARGAVHRWFFGSDYRALWTAELRVPVLDLRSFGGGLRPTTAGGGQQTKSLRFRASDGCQYGFRSVDKDPSVLPEELEGTLVEDLVTDQTSSAHPAGPAIAARLMEAAGIPHTEPQLVVLPDDSLLGPFRERFAGTLGYLERRPIRRPCVPFLARAAEIIGTTPLLARARRGPEDRWDAERYLYARLFDLFIGDWDRHRGQWTWARFGEERPTVWVPIPEDRDQALVRFDGLILSLARVYAPQLLKFDERYPGNLAGPTWNGRDIDRVLLSGLGRATWDSVAHALQARLTEGAIDSAVAAMPPEFQAITGERLTGVLRSRADLLPEAAERFYRQLAERVDVHATDADELVIAEWLPEGALDLTVAASGTPYFLRRFFSRETREVRLYLYGGRDRVVLRGRFRGPALRIVGGGGAEVVDSSGSGAARLYARGEERVSGLGSVSVDRRPFARSADLVIGDSIPSRSVPPRDWGARWRSIAWAGYGPDVGLLIGGGAYRTAYAFRHLPYSSQWRLRAGWATAAGTGRLELDGDVWRENSPWHLEMEARLSGIDVLRFHGFGNETAAPNPGEYYRVNHSETSIEAALARRVGRADLAMGPFARYSDTERQAGRIIADSLPYGSGSFARAGLRARAVYDARDVPAAARRGIVVRLSGSLVPGVWDVRRAYGDLSAEAAGYLSAGVWLTPTLALRAGGRKLIAGGLPPYQDAAFIGDSRTVRLGRQNRYAGDAALWAGAELRLRAGRVRLLLPADWGCFGLGDVGRVYLEGEKSDRWHGAYGGGLWLAYLKRSNTISVAVTQGEFLRVYARAGFAY